ncbi:MAG TPA: hypothetical protein VK213_08040 [Bacteroidales bacterium]|nr:hypothetical protein [Bacteroidales bacterium]
MKNTNNLIGSSITIIALLLVVVAGCKKEDEKTEPVLSTASVSAIKATSAISGGNITFDGGSTLTERGVCWNTSQNPTIADSKSTDGSSGTGSFTSSISGLTSNITYHVRAYATNSVGTGYGDEKIFTTSATSEYATTLSATNVTSSRATFNGTVNANFLPTNVTFEYGTSLNYGMEIDASPKVITGNSNTNISASLTGLSAVTTYHFRVKIVNSSGTAYGSDMTIFTKYVVGDSELGGIVFYVDGTGQHGLVCAATNQGSNIQWYNGSYVTTNATGTAVGTGKANTTSIVAAQGVGNYAAKICNDLVLNSYSDWFLPSIDELHLIYSVIGLTPYGYYWSSSDYDSNNAWRGYVTNLNYFVSGTDSKSSTAGTGVYIGSTIPYYIRAVREF